MSSAFQREESLFQEAIQMTDAGQRRKFLDDACAGDPALRAGVEELLAAHEIATRFFDEGAASLKSSLQDAGVESTAGENPAVKLPAEEQPGALIGHYKLMQLLGEGGCGAVYLAEQFEPVRRQVALKIIKLGMDTKNVIARFEAERQALALMDHPNIAHVFDAGATATGRPYFVMELVRGVRITEYCDQNRLDARQRLKLFVQVCHAIQHAHQKGIIHRDIKPSNILVTLHDGGPVPKVIDFGIAKATGEQLTEKTLFTAHGHFIGTPAYMSPEQAEVSVLDVDTRSDIYSLGVLLYELLTGKTPFDQQELMQSGLDEMRRTLREREPHRPSTRLDDYRMEELTQTAIVRRIEPPKLKSLLSGDLDWIVMKALEKNRNRRYQTANGLAADVLRYLHNEPVVACPPSRLYRLQKLVRRNKTVFASGLAVTAALFVGLGSVTWSFFKEKTARQQAEIRGKITQAAFAVSQDHPATADEILSGVSNVPPSLESALAFRALGKWHAVNQHWPEAAARFEDLLRVNRFDGWNTTSLDAVGCGVVLAETGNCDAYEKFAEKMASRFLDSSNSVVAERILKATLLLPPTPALRQKLEPFAETVVSRTPLPVPAVMPEPTVYTRRAAFSLLSACSFDGQRVGVRFSQKLDADEATNIANYQISGTTITNVVLMPDRQSVVLEPASGLNREFQVTVAGIRDAAQRLLSSGNTVSGSVFPLGFLAMGDAAAVSNSVVFHGNREVVKSGGSDVWVGGDHCVFQYLKVTNDFDFCLRVQSVKDTDGTGFARMGLMARDSLTDNKGHMVFVERNAGTGETNGLAGTFQVTFRPVADKPNLTEGQPSGDLPAAGGTNSWVRLQRMGTRFVCYWSTNETDWTQLYELDGKNSGDKSFTNGVLYLGIATSAHSSSVMTTAVASDFGMTPHEPVRIIAQPAPDIEWRAGVAGSLRVVASGSPLAYQWRKNGVDIPGATNDVFGFADVKVSDAGTYSVLVYNDISSLVSSDVNVSVRPDTDPCVVREVISYDGASVGVSFNKRLNAATAVRAANYQIHGTVVTNAVLMPDGRSVVLQLREAVAGKISLSVGNVEDLAGNATSTGVRIAGEVQRLRLLPVGDAAGQACSATYSGADIAIVAGGSDIGAKGDHFDHFVYQYLMVTNDFDFRLKVESLAGGGGQFARAGLMARDSATNTSCHQVMAAVNAGNTFQVIVRTENGSIQTQSQPPNPLPTAYGSNSWVRLQRVGTTFYAYCSDDGESWSKLYQFDSAADEDGPFSSALCLGIATSAWSSVDTVHAVVSHFGPTQTMPPGAMLALALFDYRQGNFVKAMDWSRRCIASYPDYQAARVATAHVILALCCQRQHQIEEARSELAKAQGMIDAQSIGESNPGNVTQGFWFDWLSARILLREAEAGFKN